MKHLLAIALALVALGTSALAQSCPVTVDKIGPRWPLTLGADTDPWHLYLFVRYTNSSAKPVAAVRFSVAFSDIINPSAASVWDYTDERQVKPGKHKDAFWADGVYTYNLGKQAKATVRLQRVVFTDGSSWDASGTECQWMN